MIWDLRRKKRSDELIVKQVLAKKGTTAYDIEDIAINEGLKRFVVLGSNCYILSRDRSFPLKEQDYLVLIECRREV